MNFLLLGAMGATVLSLGLGLWSFFKGNDPARSNQMMRLRVLLQGIALLLFSLMMWSR